MHLLIGGYAQGKLDYAKTKYNIPASEICRGETEDFEKFPGKKIYYNLHLYLKRKLDQDADIPALMTDFLRTNPDCIIICDEVGNGIVPVLDTERAYRETVGRVLCTIAEQAESVERIICGISQKIK